MEADDKIQTEDQGYQSYPSSCSNSSHNIGNMLYQNDRRGKENWLTSFKSFGEDAKVKCECPVPVLASSVVSQDSSVTVTRSGSAEESDCEELGDLLRRFDTFFREKVDAELQSVSEFMHGLLSEQQLHLQQILSSRLLVKSCPYSQQQEASSSTSQSDDLQDHKVPECLEESAMMSQHTGKPFSRHHIDQALCRRVIPD